MEQERFDKLLQQKAKAETLTPAARARKKMIQAIRIGRSVQQVERRWPLRMTAAGLLAAAAALLLFFIQPTTDRRESNPSEGVFVMADGRLAETPVPVTEPEVQFSSWATDRCVQTRALFRNQTQDIWVITWDAVPLAKHASGQPSTEYIWLEPGASFLDTASSILREENQSIEMLCCYNAYRVTADVLFWQDGPLVGKEHEAYEEQQDLLEDAFVSGALLLYAGDWQDGTAGEIELLLPDSFQERKAGMDAIDYYEQSGALDLDASGEQKWTVNCSAGFDADLYFSDREADARLIVAETSANHAMFIVDLIAANQESLLNVRPLSDQLFTGAPISFSGWIPCGENGNTLWQDGQGRWHRTWQTGAAEMNWSEGPSYLLQFAGFEPMGGLVRLSYIAP